jgi:RNA polymerase sigma factor (sigma-70 family)
MVSPGGYLTGRHVNSQGSLKKEWVLTHEAFDKLLISLNPDVEVAASRYELIRKKLITFFESRGCLDPIDYADETINRVARRLSEGVEIYTQDPSSYFYGVARNLLQEYWEDPSRLSKPLDNLTSERPLSVSPDAALEHRERQVQLDRQMECLEQCLALLPEPNRELIIEYYRGDGGQKIRSRKELARRRGIPLNALRIRALRIRQKLEGCVGQCLSQEQQGEMES